MIRTHEVTVTCPRCGDEIEAEVTVSGRYEFEIEVYGASCEHCAYEGPEMETLARDAYDRLVYDFQRYGRDDG